MTLSTTYETTEADVRELIDDALIIQVTSLRDEIGKTAEAGSKGELVKSVEVVG